MTKYREILRLSGLGLSQQNIANSCNVSKKTVNRVLKRAKELDSSWPLDESDTDAVLAEKFFPSANQVPICFNPLLTAAVIVPTVKNLSYIHSFAITSNRMSRSIVLPCISTVNPVNRLKLTGQVILQQSLILIPVKLSKHTYLSV